MSAPVLFFDHLVTPSNPYSIAVFSHWYPSPFLSAPLDLASTSSASPVSPDSASTGGNSSKLNFSTAEHWMMFHKAALFDPSACSAILSASTPEEARDLGRKIPNFDREVWGRHADKVVEEGNYKKFSVNPESSEEESTRRQKALFDTAGRRLVECNPNDRIWGIGFSVEDAMAHQSEWGQNRMGDALGRARERLIKESEAGRNGADKD